MLVVGLALHNLVMSQLYRAGVRGAVALGDRVLEGRAAGRRARRRPVGPSRATASSCGRSTGSRSRSAPSSSLYALVPQSVLGGAATHKGVLYGTRHDLLPVLAYFLGRALALTPAERSRLCRTVLVTAAGVAAYGLIDVYVVPLSWWRHSAGWFSDQLGLSYHGLSGLPENFVYNEGGGVVFRRLTSTFLSPLASSYLLVVALLFVPLRGRRWGPPLAALLFVALLATHTRAALLALVVGLLVIAALRRALFPAGLAVVVAVLGLLFVESYDHLGPRTHFTPTELAQQEANAHKHPTTNNDPTSANESSASEHLASLRAGDSHRRPPSVRVRDRQRRRHGGAHEGDGRGGRVDLHRACRRDRVSSAAWSSSPGRSRSLPGCDACRGSRGHSPRCSSSACRRT